MRVLVLSSVFPNPKQPTLGVFVRERIRRVARECEVVVIAPIPWFPLNGLIRGPRWSGIPEAERQDGLRVFHPRVLCVPRYLKCLDGLLYAASLLPLLARLRREFPFDLIDAHFAYPDGMAAYVLARVFRCPVTVTLRGTIVPLSRYRLRRMQIAWTLRGATRIFSVSHSLKDVATALGIPPASIRVIPNGVDTSAFRPGSRSDARRALGLSPDRVIVLSVGSCSMRKGHQRVLAALPAVVARCPHLLYVVVGGPSMEGDTEPLLRRSIHELGLDEHVRLVGTRPHAEIPQWLRAADLFCLATSNEGRANVLLEALASGLPVVTTRVGGSAEVVREGQNGLLVAPGDIDGLSRALLRALDTPWDRDRIAREWQAQTWERAASEIVEEFRELVRGADSGQAVAHAAPEGKKIL